MSINLLITAQQIVSAIIANRESNNDFKKQYFVTQSLQNKRLCKFFENLAAKYNAQNKIWIYTPLYVDLQIKLTK